MRPRIKAVPMLPLDTAKNTCRQEFPLTMEVNLMKVVLKVPHTKQSESTLATRNDHVRTLLMFFRKPRKELMLIPPTKASVRYCRQTMLAPAVRLQSLQLPETAIYIFWNLVFYKILGPQSYVWHGRDSVSGRGV